MDFEEKEEQKQGALKQRPLRSANFKKSPSRMSASKENRIIEQQRNVKLEIEKQHRKKRGLAAISKHSAGSVDSQQQPKGRTKLSTNEIIAAARSKAAAKMATTTGTISVPSRALISDDSLSAGIVDSTSKKMCCSSSPSSTTTRKRMKAANDADDRKKEATPKLDKPSNNDKKKKAKSEEGRKRQHLPKQSAKTSKQKRLKKEMNVAQTTTSNSSNKQKKNTEPSVVTSSTISTGSTTTAKRLLKKHFSGTITVGLTGAREGDILQGCGADTANVVLRVNQGTIGAPAIIRQSIEALMGRDAIIQVMAKQFGLSVSTAAMQYNDSPIANDVPNHQPLGQACTHHSCDCEPAAHFIILNQGVWQHFAEEHGNGKILKNIVQQGRSVCYRDVLRLMTTHGKPGGKTLILRPKLFQIVHGPVALSETDPRLNKPNVHILDATSWITTGSKITTSLKSSVFDMDQRLFRLPVSALSAPSKDYIGALILESLQGLLPDGVLSPRHVQTGLDALKTLTVGGLKSLLQKTVRFHAMAVDMSLVVVRQQGGSSQDVHLPAALVAATAAGLLFTEAGNFTPELQLYTRGCTSALKRIAIILVEDAWVPNAETSVIGLMALALATQRMPEYHPPKCVVLAAMRLAARAAASPVLVAWRKSVTPQNPTTIHIDKRGAQALRDAAELLRIVKSFPGDMDMMDSVAQSANRSGSLKLTKALAKHRLPLMPICHCVDQHTYRGIGHIGPSTGSTFAKRFQLIFGTTTGFNPRQSSIKGFEERAIVKETRFAQQCIARFAFRVTRSVIPQQSNTVTFRLPLDSGTLAAAAGPIPVKVKVGRSSRDVLVMLGVRCPEDEIVMLKPARATRDLFGTLSDDERASAVAEARTKQLSVRSPVLKSARTIAFDKGHWHLDGEPWEKVAQAGCTVTVPVVEAPTWVSISSDMAAVLTSDNALEEALMMKCDTGLVPDAESLVKKLVASASDAVTLRAISMLRQQYVKITLPTPALDGGLGSDQLVAYKGDWDVFRLLALIARLAPGALRPTMPPNFTVVDANLLRIVERWMMRGMRDTEGQAAGVNNAWVNHPLWTGMVKAEHKLMEHQLCAVANMRRRDTEADTGHFLIMDTGVGKTVTSLCYLYRWLVGHARDMAKRIIWVTPKGTVDNLVEQLRSKWSAPVWSVPRLSTSKKCKKGDCNRLTLKDYHVNVIHADHLRGMIDAGLSELAPSSAIVFDEVDEMYAPTLRTSAARRLAQLCAKFVAQTATPMRKNESQLLAWLSDTCSFPVDSGNLLVAASGMVSIQLELGIASKEELLLVPMTDDVRKRLRVLLVNRRWLPMAQLVQEHTDAAMVEKAVKVAAEDRKKYSDGGVLMVADTKDHAQKLISECNAHGIVRAGGFDTLELPNAAEFGIVIVPKDKDRGYNSACRLGSMVTGVYAGNGASRHQMRGRLRRLGQRRKVVTFHTVAMENSLLHLLHIRHDAVDSMNISLQELGDKFSADVLRALETSVKKDS